MVEHDIRCRKLVQLLKMPSTRSIKTHLPFNLLPQQIQISEKILKIIYVARNPKDVCESNYAPYWSHIRQFWKWRHQPNVLFIPFEDMKRNLKSVLDQATAFMGKSFSEQDKGRLLYHLSFEPMKSNPYATTMRGDEITDQRTRVHGTERKTHFMRKGKVGSPHSIDNLDK